MRFLKKGNCMKFTMVLLGLIIVCFPSNAYSMEKQNKTQVTDHLLKAQNNFDQGQKILSGMELKLALTSFASEEGYLTYVTTERSKANDFFCKSRRYVQRVFNNQDADEVTKNSALDIEKKIDAISWASK
jgi:hypothetical protein